MSKARLRIFAGPKCYLFDNSSEEYKLIAKMEQNQLLLEVEPNELPNWFIKYVLKYYM